MAFLPYVAYETTSAACIPFGPSHPYSGTMASADFCQFSRALLHGLPPWEIHPSCR
jgi:hypothetical protein